MRLPKYLYASLIVCVGGLLNGLDTGVIGPITTMPQFVESFGGSISPSTRGIVVSSVLISATFTSLFSGALSDSMGRSRAIAIGSAWFALGAALESGAVNLTMFIVGRLIVGIGEGLFLSTLVVYVCEISPPGKRGPLASLVQMAIITGICIGYFMCYGTVKLDSTVSWRFPLAIQAGIALWLAIVAEFYLPQSPRWLAYRNRFEEAAETWARLDVSESDREEFIVGEMDPGAERSVLPASSPGSVPLKVHFQQEIKNIKNVFKSAEARNPMLLGVFLMSMQQLSGIDGVLYYAPLLFEQAGLSSSKASFLASGVSAILFFLASIPAFLFADKWGRRASTIYGGLLVAITMLLIGSLYASDSVHKSSGAARWVVIVSIYVFAIAYCMTWALSIKIFASEIHPIATRATATSLSQSANCITNFFVAFITPVLLARSSSAIYFLFAGCTLFTVLVCLVVMPETGKESLEKNSVTFQNYKPKDALIIQASSRLLSSVKNVHKRRARGHHQSQVGILAGGEISV